MKQHGMLLSVLLAALLLLGAGCYNGKVTDVSPSTAPNVTGGENTIEGFKEGETVEVSNLPEKVTKAVKEKYPNATVKSATYATYMDKQMYHLMLEGAGDNTTEIYAQADGTLLPFNAQSTPEGTSGGANGGSTNKG